MDISYKVIRSSRKTLAIQIMPAGEVVVRAPKGLSSAAIERFVQSKRPWLEKHLEKQPPAQPRLTDAEVRELASRALVVIPALAARYAPIVGVTYGNITIRNQRTRWGSCSGKGNLNFNCLLMLAPDHVTEYVVVHELCHRKEMNHSSRFWAEVARVLPEYEKSKRWLDEYGPALIGRLR